MHSPGSLFQATLVSTGKFIQKGGLKAPGGGLMEEGRGVHRPFIPPSLFRATEHWYGQSDQLRPGGNIMAEKFHPTPKNSQYAILGRNEENTPQLLKPHWHKMPERKI